jgi:hypothetical protein
MVRAGYEGRKAKLFAQSAFLRSIDPNSKWLAEEGSGGRDKRPYGARNRYVSKTAPQFLEWDYVASGQETRSFPKLESYFGPLGDRPRKPTRYKQKINGIGGGGAIS